jgi:hypothetical protein
MFHDRGVPLVPDLHHLDRANTYNMFLGKLNFMSSLYGDKNPFEIRIFDSRFICANCGSVSDCSCIT